MEIFTLMGTVAINKAQAIQDIEAIKTAAKGASTEMGRSFGAVGKYITDNATQFRQAGKVMTMVGGVITAAFTALVLKTVEAEDELGDMSERIGETVENLSALSYVAKMSETNIETLELSLKFLTRAIYDTSKGTGTAKDIFKELGISVSDTEGNLRPMVDVLKDVATKIAAIEDPTKQAALAMELFGSRTGPQLLPMLKRGGAGIDELMKKAKELGLVISTEDAEAADKFEKSMITLKATLAASGRDIAHILMPPLLEFIEKVTVIVPKVREWADANQVLVGTLVKDIGVLGGVLLVLGPLTMALPSLVAGFKLWSAATFVLSEKFATLALTLGLTAPELLIMAGAFALVAKAVYGWIDALEESERIREMEVASVKSTEDALKKLQEAYNLTDQELQYFIENHKLSASVLERVAQDERDLAKARMGSISTMEMQAKSFQELSDEIDTAIFKNKELTESQKLVYGMSQKIYDATHTATEKKIQDLNDECVALINNMETNLMTMEQIDQYRQVMLTNIIKDSSERESYLRNMEEIQNRIFELTHTQTEIEMKDLDAKKIAYVEEAKQAMLSATEKEAAMVKIQELYELEKASIIKTAVTRIEQEIASLDESIQSRKESGEAIDDLIKKRDAEIANLNKLKVAYGEVAVEAAKTPEGKSQKMYYYVDAEGKKIGLTNINQLSQAQIEAGIHLEPLAKGGPVGRKIPGYARGGGIDNIPINATEGEYLIAKPMVDFIKRTGMVTGGLIKSIMWGAKTPQPSEDINNDAVIPWSSAIREASSEKIPTGKGEWKTELNFGPNSVVINAKTLDDKTINEAGEKIFNIVEKKVRASGLGFVRV